VLRQIRIFLSSPGDVAEERRIARSMVKDVLPVDPFIRGKASIDIISWDDPNAPASLSAHLSPQQAIERGLPSPSDCDIVIVVLWSRLGTPVLMPDGTRFRSGTEYEYHDALKAIRSDNERLPAEGKRVQSILLYRRTEAPTISLTAPEEARNEALQQWHGVQDFFAQFRARDGSLLGSVNEYGTPHEFQQMLAHHLKTEINLIIEESFRHEQTGQAGLSDGAFYAPTFDNTVLRDSIVSTIAKEHTGSSIVIITGLSGNGKSFVAAQLACRLHASGQATSALWVDCEKAESLESLLARLAHKASITAQTAKAQCRQLLAYLRATNSVLFLDDYQSCDHESMDPLLSLAASSGGPAHLVLVSRIVPDEALALPGVTIHSIADFTENETSALLGQRGVVGLDASLVRDLIQKTGALPLAMALFCGLINSGADARGLLDGELIEAERLKRWFDELSRMLSPRAIRLLGFLSLIDGPFDEFIPHMFLSGTAEAEIRREFRSLHRGFLVERYDRDRWKVHDLVASIGRLSLAHDLVKSGHAALGRHYKGLAEAARDGGDEETWFDHMIKACRAFDRSAERDDLLERSLAAVAAEIKRRGAHVVFLELSRNLIGNRAVSELWMYYHFAHCCFVLGLFDEAIEYTRRILQSATKRDPTLRLSASRLYSEALAAVGDKERAHENLIGALAAAKGQRISSTSYAQARSVLAGIETNLNKFGLAHQHIEELINEAELGEQPLGKAVACCRMGLLQLRLGRRNEASHSFQEALALFRGMQNLRGQAWAQVGLAQAAFDAGDFAACASYLSASIPLQEQVGGYDPEYEQTIHRLRASATASPLAEILLAEATRIAQLKVGRRSFARRLHGAV
jgi:tetratricopeptide (TPR) repeat protein